MSTLSNSDMQVASSMQTSHSTIGRTIRWAGRSVIKLLIALLALLLALPVVLLPGTTAVPWFGWLALGIVDIALLVILFTRAQTPVHVSLTLAAIMGISILAVALSQSFAATPPIRDSTGRSIPGSIAVLEAVELNGSRQWITIRGHDQTKPVLLFLAGGPGGSQLAATRKFLGELEKHFVVVNWDQPGAGKSFRAADFATLAPEQYIADGHALTLYLRQRFGQEKLYILGESWGSILGVWLVQRYPDHYQAMIGAAQMVDFLETDTYDYTLALRLAFESGDFTKVGKLIRQGPPPYYGEGVAWKVTEYVLYLSQHMTRNLSITGPGYDTLGDIASPEYGLYDKVNYFRGLITTMNAVWPQLWEIDLRKQAPRLEVPVYFLEGRHDVNAPPVLVESYLQRLEAPHKELIWFEHSGHSPWVDEAARVVDVIVNTVLANAQ